MTHATMHQVADALVAYCRAGEDERALNELYHPQAVSVEAAAGPGQDSRETHTLEGIRGKHAWWNSATEMHSASVDGPYPHGDDRFAVIFEMDVTMKDTGQRMQMKEVGVYTVEDGKITREEFYYPTG